MTETGPIELTFDTKQKVTDLEVIARLYAANEFAEATIQIVVRNNQEASVRPSPAEVGAHIKP